MICIGQYNHHTKVLIGASLYISNLKYVGSAHTVTRLLRLKDHLFLDVFIHHVKALHVKTT